MQMRVFQLAVFNSQSITLCYIAIIIVKVATLVTIVIKLCTRLMHSKKIDAESKIIPCMCVHMRSG